VGLDLHQDIHWVIHPPAAAIQLLAAGKINALVGFPPVPQDLRAQQIGHAVVNSVVDHPWSQYFCCKLTGNRAVVRQYPVTTKRALRAILKATDLCAHAPACAAQRMVEKGFTPHICK
jgi:NitT/TauT family transport system substrate-binding protein